MLPCFLKATCLEPTLPHMQVGSAHSAGVLHEKPCRGAQGGVHTNPKSGLATRCGYGASTSPLGQARMLPDARFDVAIKNARKPPSAMGPECVVQGPLIGPSHGSTAGLVKGSIHALTPPPAVHSGYACAAGRAFQKRT